MVAAMNCPRRMSDLVKCSDQSPCRRPVRRPSIDGSAVSESELEVLTNELKALDHCDECSCTSATDDFDDDATQVTSNQVKRCSRATDATASTAKSSGLCSGIHNRECLNDSSHHRHRKQPGEITFDIATEADEVQSISVESTSSSRVLTEERVRSFMVDYYEDFHSIFQTHRHSSVMEKKDCFTAFCEHYYTPNFLFVRPSGNPLNLEGFIKVNSEDIVGIRIALVSIESIQIMAGGMAAAVVYTADQEFEYKGHPNSDRTVITGLIHIGSNGEVQIGHEHRCVGKPIPKTTRWES